MTPVTAPSPARADASATARTPSPAPAGTNSPAPPDASAPAHGSAPAHALHPAPADASGTAHGLNPAPAGTSNPGRRRVRGADERGDYAVFIAVIAVALLFFGGIAYDAPRLTAARQDALHAADEGARVAAATIAAGGTLEQAEEAAEKRMNATGIIYGAPIDRIILECSGTRVRVIIGTQYLYQSVLRLIRPHQPIIATGAAEAQLRSPGNTRLGLHYLGECPLPLP